MLAYRIGIIVLFLYILGLAPASAQAWDCRDRALDCSTVIIHREGQAAFRPDRPLATWRELQQEIVRVPRGTDPQAFLESLAAQPGILHVEPAFVTDLAVEDNASFLESQTPPSATIANAPNDTLFDQQDHFGGLTGSLLAMDDTWSLLTDSPIIIAVIDSGIDYTHRDLAENMWVNTDEIPDNGIDDDDNGYVDDVYGYDFYNHEPDPFDQHMHGTHLAGIIGAVGDNQEGVSGLLWNVQVMALRFTSDDGVGNTARAIEAIHYAVDQGASVINLSWTVRASASSGGSVALRDVITDYSKDGVIFVAASGNGDYNFIGFDLDDDPLYPASIASNNLISVGALDRVGKLAEYSNYGHRSVHLIAPGTSIMSTKPNNEYGRMSGTSMATAFVSATAAMVLTQSPDFSATDVKNVILNTINHDDDLDGLIMTGGSLNMAKAITSDNVGAFIAEFTESAPKAPPSSSGGCTLIPNK